MLAASASIKQEKRRRPGFVKVTNPREPSAFGQSSSSYSDSSNDIELDADIKNEETKNYKEKKKAGFQFKSSTYVSKHHDKAL